MEMARVNSNWWSHSKTVVVIWSICIILSFSLLRMALNRSSYPNQPYPSSPSSDSSISNEERKRLYDKMARDLDENGAAFLNQGETSQSLSLSDIFTIKDGLVKPVHKPANPPVRATVLYLSPEYSIPISNAVKQVFGPQFDGGKKWLIAVGHFMPYFCFENYANAVKNSTLYHFSMFHASHHIKPVPATEEEIATEINAVRDVVNALCPLKIALDRVVLTSTGVLLGCWQVISGPDPATIRANLRTALPHAPEKQLYDAAILHTSFARLLGPSKASTSTDLPAQLQLFHELVAQLNNKIRGFEAVVSELWYVEEYDVLALGLDGRMKAHRFQLRCKTT